MLRPSYSRQNTLNDGADSSSVQSRPLDSFYLSTFQFDSSTPILELNQFKGSERIDKLDQNHQDKIPRNQEDQSYFKTFSSLHPRVYWWWIIVLGQILLVGFPIGFYCTISYYQISLPDRISEFARKSPGSITFIVTLISSTFSGLSSFLFSHAVVNFLAHRLARPTTLFELSTGIEISKGQFIFRRKYPTWTILTLLVGLLLKTLTASFATLITPTAIVVSTPLEGVEIDIGTESFVKLLENSDTYKNMISSLRSNNPTSFSSILVSAGMAAAYARLKFTRLLEFDHAMFNSSTGGILPVSAFDAEIGPTTNSVEQNLIGIPVSENKPIRYKLKGQNVRSNEVIQPSNHTILQQGFTSLVDCMIHDHTLINATTQSSPILVSDSTRALNYSLNKWSFNASCPNGDRLGEFSFDIHFFMLSKTDLMNLLDLEDVVTAISTNSGSGGLVMVALCQDQNFNGIASPGNHCEGYKYLKPRVCSIRPVITKLNVKYERNINFESLIEVLPLPENSRDLSIMVLRLIVNSVRGSQNIYTNTFGDGLKSIYGTIDQKIMESVEVDSWKIDENMLNEIIESYFRGQLEFIGSYLRVSFSGKDVFENDIIPESMSKPIEGLWHSSTIGWDRISHRSAIVTLSPILLVGILSILLMIKSRGKVQNRFPLDDLICLIEAAGSGDLVNGFEKLEQEEQENLLRDFDECKNRKEVCRLEELERVKVRLEQEFDQESEWNLKYCP
ncbi:uncharacterized protein MELLADRAFT_109108 [Melampsora larici-populina 98AG31]|uniref:Uncharacterized protein n=1 Tax=Melampsora larici-populina (strain 98AG31 / pathotype 3-4-7) TaxID=747676 RepID=F4RVC3_MELLP|nr:uncharacterized protein MELLADRAFT_109108 [Melampsora larici-populina 98AG31]EGG03694.1 hypothetical protein MELLADRAFT_109108 [Melampsora larici-populina 98AG31]